MKRTFLAAFLISLLFVSTPAFAVYDADKATSDNYAFVYPRDYYTALGAWDIAVKECVLMQGK